MHPRPEQMSSPVNLQNARLGRAATNFAAADLLENIAWESPLKDMRQGIASRRRHVAPAVSLC
jgi:hypothetical protein